MSELVGVHLAVIVMDLVITFHWTFIELQTSLQVLSNNIPMFIAASHVPFICKVSFVIIDREKDFHFSYVLKEKCSGWECVSFLFNVKSLSPFLELYALLQNPSDNPCQPLMRFILLSRMKCEYFSRVLEQLEEYQTEAIFRKILSLWYLGSQSCGKTWNVEASVTVSLANCNVFSFVLGWLKNEIWDRWSNLDWTFIFTLFTWSGLHHFASYSCSAKKGIQMPGYFNGSLTRYKFNWFCNIATGIHSLSSLSNQHPKKDHLWKI